MREFFHNTAAANVTQEELNRIKIPLRFDKDLFIFYYGQITLKKISALKRKRKGGGAL